MTILSCATLPPSPIVHGRPSTKRRRGPLKHYLAACRAIDFSGPHGWEHSAVDLGRVTPVAKGPIEGVSAVRRRVLPLVELRAPFFLPRSELAAADRGVDHAPPRLGHRGRRAGGARGGWPRVPRLRRCRHRGDHPGVATSRSHDRRRLRALPGACRPCGRDPSCCRHRRAVCSRTRVAYASLASPRRPSGAAIRLPSPARDPRRPMVWAPAVDGAVVFSQRGGTPRSRSQGSRSATRVQTPTRCSSTSRRRRGPGRHTRGPVHLAYPSQSGSRSKRGK